MNFPHVGIARDAFLFKLRRTSRGLASKQSKPPEVKAIAVDLDGLLYSEDHVRILAGLVAGKKGQGEYDEGRKQAARGRVSFEQIIRDGQARFLQEGLSETHFVQAANEAADGINGEIVSALKTAQADGKKIIFVTRGFEGFAKEIARLILEKHGLKADGIIGVGHEADESGRITKFNNIIGFHNREMAFQAPNMRTERIPVITKWKALRNLGFRQNQVVMLTNDAVDAADLKYSGMGVMISKGVQSSSTVERLGARLGTNDIFLKTNDPFLRKKLEVLFRNPNLAYNNKEFLKAVKR